MRYRTGSQCNDFRSGTEREKTRRSCNYPSQTIWDTLKFCNILDSNIMNEGIAVIKSAANKSCCNSMRNMLSKVEILIKSDSQILR